MSDPDDNPYSGSTPPPADDKGKDKDKDGEYQPAHGADDKDKDDDKGGRKRWLLLLLLLLLILLLLLCGGFAYMKWWQKSEPDPAASPSVAATASAAVPASPSAATDPSAAASPTAAASPSAAASPTAAPSPEPALLTVPNVVGKKAEDAEKILAAAGFTNVRFVGDDGKELTLLVSWKVVKQSVKAGSKVAADTEIVLTNESVSNGKG
ncbi:hypothetical protein CS0771_00840 [Catellatospora sp. IY07-71]|uniref:PASTA domain-containing protein n=1 Tax=Catellatospora sp. IY07-71 TaxID=2728827 RepID=UPI001BB36E01|nr:PASTA domain-containing protein [Catellatospora sp. IY07-71]BCJ70540.1 hypothetical protein CS0771_00840 [Catellatospora sp. IY07-71]